MIGRLITSQSDILRVQHDHAGLSIFNYKIKNSFASFKGLNSRKQITLNFPLSVIFGGYRLVKDC